MEIKKKGKKTNTTWSKEQIDFLIENGEYASKDYLMKHLDKTWQGIYNKMRDKLGIRRKTRDKKYINHKYFNDVDEKKIYFLGFIYMNATTKIFNKENKSSISYNRISIETSIKKLDILNYLLNELELPSDNVIELKRCNTYRITICNMNIINNLNEFGIAKNNKLNNNPPVDIEREIFSHFVRGLIDGKSSYGIKEYYMYIKFRCGDDYSKTIEFKNLIESFNIKNTKILIEKKISKVSIITSYYLAIRCTDDSFYNFIYKDKEKSFYCKEVEKEIRHYAQIIKMLYNA